MHAIFDKFNRTDKRHACMISYWNIFAIPSASSSNVSNNSSIPARPLPRTSPPLPPHTFFASREARGPPLKTIPLKWSARGKAVIPVVVLYCDALRLAELHIYSLSPECCADMLRCTILTHITRIQALQPTGTFTMDEDLAEMAALR